MRLRWAERITPMSLNPGSIPVLASDLGLFKEEGIELEITEYLGSPPAADALRTGAADFAQIDVATVIRTAAQTDVPIKAIWGNSIHADTMLMATSDILRCEDLKHRRIGISTRLGTDHFLVSAVLDAYGINPETEVTWVEGLTPLQRADKLFSREIDASTASNQNYVPRFEGKPGVHVLVDTEGMRRLAASAFLLVVTTTSVLEQQADLVDAITRTLIRAARMFNDDSSAWVDAALRRRPDISRENALRLAKRFNGRWPVDGNQSRAEYVEIAERLRATWRVREIPAIPVEQWVTHEFTDRALRALASGTDTQQGSNTGFPSRA